MNKDVRLVLVLGINLTMVLGLVLVGLLAHSLGVLASGVDYLGDALGTTLSLAALRLSHHEHRHPGSATSFAALTNSILLLLVTLAVAAEAIRRLSTGAPPVHGVPVVIVSVLAATAMIVCALILGDVEGDLSMESVMLDSVADAAAAIGVAVSGTVILLASGWYWLDSGVALVIAVVIGYHALRLIRKVVARLRDRQTAAGRA